MKATELRIGNWCKIVKSPFPQENGEHQIEAITIHYFESKEDLILESIPLTEEWLLKFGLNKLNRDVPAFEAGNLIVEWLFERWTGRLYYDAYTSIQIIQVKYVHQLQNLYFALTGEELTIK
jgi:hypothetical protein